jgi:hypothetical protein
MLKNIYLIIIIALLITSAGCSKVASNAISNVVTDSGVSHGSSDIQFVGDYKFIGNDGSSETGKLYQDTEGHIRLIPDRGISSFSNWWFDVDFTFINPRYYDSSGTAIYYAGDNVEFNVSLDYKRGLPLNLYPIIYSSMQLQQRSLPDLALLPGNSVSIYDPLLIRPYGEIEVKGNYQIPLGIIPSNYQCSISIFLEVFNGQYQFQLARGLGGMWCIENR